MGHWRTVRRQGIIAFGIIIIIIFFFAVLSLSSESIRTLVYPDTDCFMLCMSITDEAGWNDLPKWVVRHNDE